MIFGIDAPDVRRRRKTWRTALTLSGLALLTTGCLLAANFSSPTTPEEKTRALDELRKLVAQASNQPSENALAAYERRFPQSEGAALARFRRGYDRWAAKSYAAAIRTLEDPMIAEYSRLGDYALFYLGRAQFDAGQSAQAQATFSQVAERFPKSLLAREAILNAGRAAAARADLSQIETALRPLLEKDDGAALAMLADAQEAAGKTDAAAATRLRIYFESPHSPEAATATAKLTDAKILPDAPAAADPKRRQTRAERLFANRKYAEAAEAYATLARLAPDAVTTDVARHHFGVSLQFAQKFQDAAARLSAVSDKDKELHAEALFFLAEAQRKGGFGGYAATVERFLAAYPNHPRAGEALATLAEYAEKRGGGAEYFNRLARSYPEQKVGQAHSFKKAWKFHQAGDFAVAAPLLTEHVALFPASDYKGMAAYWAARDEERLNRPARAVVLYEAVVRRYRYGYYGQMAAGRLKALANVKPEALDPKSALARAAASIQPAQPLPETAAAESDPALERASELRVVGLTDFALAELEDARRLAPTSPKVNREIARVYRDLGDTLRAVQSLQRAHPDYLAYQGDEVTREEWEIFFPLPEWETIQREAKNNGLDPYIVAGLIRQESVFNPRARSRANAYGLMQLLPSTGRLVARKSGVGGGVITDEQLYNPKLNITLGVSYLADMVKQFGRYEYAFAAYNGGPGRVATWLKTLPTENLDVWVDSIPITETRLYVQGVTRNAAHYRRLYGGETKK
jgi:soluble lytic murein transglycosylase